MFRTGTVALAVILSAIPAFAASAAAQTTQGSAARTLEEVILPAESVIGLQIHTSVTAEQAKLDDPVEAKVTRDVKIGETTVIPAGTRVLGAVTLVERPAKGKGKARLGVTFHTLVMTDAPATRVSIRTDPIYRETEPAGPRNSARMSGSPASGVPVLGAILAGRGSGTGAVPPGARGGAPPVPASEGSVAAFQAGGAVTVRLQEAVTITIER